MEIEKAIRSEILHVQSVHFYRDAGMVTISATILYPEWNGRRQTVEVTVQESDMLRFPTLYNDVIVGPMEALLIVGRSIGDEDIPNFELS